MNNTNGSEVMKQVEKQQLRTAFARVVNVDSPSGLYGKPDDLLRKFGTGRTLRPYGVPH